MSATVVSDGVIEVVVEAPDAVTRSGVAGVLRGQPGVRVVEDAGDAQVVVVAVDELDEAALTRVRASQRTANVRIVLVVGRTDEKGLLAAVEAGVTGLLRRSEAAPEALAAAVRAAAGGDGTMPPDLLGRLLSAVGRLHQQVLAPRGLSFSGLTEREIAVLRLAADGLGTSEIAQALAYSERTIKNVIHDVTVRLGLRNRTHAVAYALREGLI